MIVIGDRCIGKDYPTYVIAELGINHNGDIAIAEEMAQAAKDAGADAVKVQMRTPEICVPKDQWEKMRDTPWGYISYIEYRHKIELGYGELTTLRNTCGRIGIPLIASVWDTEAFAKYMRWLNPLAIKIPSACITDHALLQDVWKANCNQDIPVIMSTGMSTEEQISQAAHTYDWKQLAILHCTSIYPCPDEKLDLRVIRFLENEYGDKYTIGYSNHSPGIVHSAVAVGLGADIVEAHLTLDRSMWGTDQAASLEPHGFAKMVKYIRATEAALGWDRPQVYGEEYEAAKKLRRIK